MSLLNQVLQDLENRKAEDHQAADYLHQLKTVPEQGPQASYRLVIIIVLLVLSLITLIWLLLNQPQNETLSEVSTPTKLTEGPLIQNQPVNTVTTESAVQEITPEAAPKQASINKEAEQTEQTEQSSVSKRLIIVTEQPAKPLARPEKAQKPQIKTGTQPTKEAVQSAPNKTFDLKKLAEQTFQLAQQQSSQKSKQEKLQQVLKLDKKHLSARLLLAEMLMKQGQLQQSAYLLDQGLKLFPAQQHLIQLRSQLYLQNNQSQQAIELLQKITDRKQHNESYLALLAAAYQQNQQYADAQLLYQQLVRLRPQQAQYWLGLGLAHDKQGHEHVAVNAYQQALNKNTLQTAVVSYIKQRLSILK